MDLMIKGNYIVYYDNEDIQFGTTTYTEVFDTEADAIKFIEDYKACGYYNNFTLVNNKEEYQ